jgi:hypothetical protein
VFELLVGPHSHEPSIDHLLRADPEANPKRTGREANDTTGLKEDKVNVLKTDLCDLLGVELPISQAPIGGATSTTVGMEPTWLRQETDIRDRR